MSRVARVNAAIVLLVVSASPGILPAADTGPNVLFIAVDDLRPQLGCYGADDMHTPHIDRLAARGIVFQRAYCMVPTCGASRSSLMTGIRPLRHRFVNYLAWAEKDAPGIATLNTHFKRHGYYTLSNGKVFHHAEDSADGWSEPAFRVSGVRWYADEKYQQLHEQTGRGPAYEIADLDDGELPDGHVLKKSLADLARLAEREEPFFLAVGFFKPHLPLVAPRRYWELYDREEIELPANYHPPEDAPRDAIHNWGELRNYHGIPQKGPVSDETARALIHGYYACVSYTDALIGRLLAELDRLELSDETIVVLWGDHGWNLGEHTLWCKHSCFETSMHAPLIVAAPGIEGGRQTAGLTEFIDIYPSLCQLAGLPLPEHLEGRSFVPLMREPERAWKAAAIGRYYGGDTIRTDRYRFTRYSTMKGALRGRMLYDHRADPGENVNLAGREAQRLQVERLTRQLHEVVGRGGLGRDTDAEDHAPDQE
ncbi:MAG: iduronate sulfatase [Planctomycetota bacterium]|nr:MAG: iduronate sulfatase [Planctomycetota bacterium]